VFKSNKQPGLFSFETELCKMQLDLPDASKEKWFYNLKLRNVSEINFKPLYSEKVSKYIYYITVILLIYK
jgi:hypothetical protein